MGEHARKLQRRVQALDLYLHGLSFTGVHDALALQGVRVDRSTVVRDITDALGELAELDVRYREQVRQELVEKARLLWKWLEPRASVGDPRAILAGERVLGRLQKLTGAYPPGLPDVPGLADVAGPARVVSGDVLVYFEADLSHWPTAAAQQVIETTAVPAAPRPAAGGGGYAEAGSGAAGAAQSA